MAKSVILRPKNLCVGIIGLGLITLILCFYYQQLHYKPPINAVNRNHMNMVRDVPKTHDKGVIKSIVDSAQGALSILHQPSPVPEACHISLRASNVTIDTVEVYRNLDFNNYDREYWSSEWSLRWKKAKMNRDLPLKVIVVPHSHNDPGWLQTFEGYFMAQTAHILNNMVDFLDKHPDFKFVWSEISFFAKWWRSLENRPHLRPKVRSLLVNGQLEILTGGWVMTDEAGAHLYSMLDQLIEGHQWLKTHVGVTPKNGWSIDPFGHGNAVPYLLEKSGIHNTFIQRTHYGWKRYLSGKQNLEFLWKTKFQRKSNGIMCHMAPYDLYSIKHTCGPDTEVCLRFDFRNLRGEHSESRAEIVSKRNIHSLATLLLDQYSKVGSLFKHNVALILLGDDFRYDHGMEWKQQYDNYKQLFDYVNQNSDRFNDTHMAFGTLKDYWNEVYKRQKTFPTLSGDFMPYGDVYGEGLPNYWTGYYTTRPYFKAMARELEHFLRAAEIVFGFGRQHLLQLGHSQLKSRLDADYILLVEARSSLGLFQHHDAITGTSKEMVMNDYGQKLFQAIKDSLSVISHIVQYVLVKDKPVYVPGYRPVIPFTTYLSPDYKRSSFDALPVKVPIDVSPMRPVRLVVFNTHASVQQEAVRVHVLGPVQKVTNPRGEDIPFQLNPVWGYSAEISTDLYELLFISDLPPISSSIFEILGQDVGETSRTPAATIKLFLSDAWGASASPTLSNGHIFNFESNEQEDIALTNANMHAVFSHNTGLLKSVNQRSVAMSFGAYRSSDFHSGAYLFRPDVSDPRRNVTGRFPVIRLVTGPLMSEIIVVYPDAVMHRSRVYHVRSGPLMSGIEMETSFDLSIRQDFFEMYMSLHSDISSGQNFYTDSGGFQIVKRIRNDLLPVEANYFPMTSAVYLEDVRNRLTVLASHSHGITSMRPGHLEIMLDRKLRYDDSRGLAEGVIDNRHTMSKFWLLYENVLAEQVRSPAVPLLSRSAHRVSAMLNYPAIILAGSPTSTYKRELHSELSFLTTPLPCDLHLLALRTLPSPTNYNEPASEALLVLQNKAADCEVQSVPLKCIEEPSSTGIIFTNVTITGIFTNSLTGTKEGPKVSPQHLRVDPHEIETFTLKFGDQPADNEISQDRPFQG